MGSDTTLEKALYKAFELRLHLPTFGNVVFTIADDAKEALVWLVVSKILVTEFLQLQEQRSSLQVMDCKLTRW